MLYDERPPDFSGDNLIVSAAMFVDPIKRVLLLQRKEKGLYGAVAGKAEPGEDVYEALVREAWEETKVVLDPNDKPNFRKWYVVWKKKSFVFYLTWIHFDPRPTIVLNENEHTDYRWVTLNDALGTFSLVEDMHECMMLTKRNTMSVH